MRIHLHIYKPRTDHDKEIDTHSWPKFLMEESTGHYTGKAEDCPRNGHSDLEGWAGEKNWENFTIAVDREEMKKKKLLGSTIIVTALIAIAIGTWYAYCHYYPLLMNRRGGSTSANIVDDMYRFNDINSTHLQAARQRGIKPISDKSRLNKEQLAKIESCNYYKVDRLTHSVPYLTSSTKELLEKVGERFQKSLKEQGLEKHRIIVTSMLRTDDDVNELRKVNGNAAANSAHQYATTFDITYVRFDRLSLIGKTATNKQLANILGSVLKHLRDEGLCYVKYERNQRCFHITSRR